MAIVLIGPPASGKSRVGRRLARALALPLIDTDKVIQTAHGAIPQIFSEHGEPYFRQLERAAVVDALKADGVVSLGGGAVLDPATQADLRPHVVVMLDTTAEAVERRLANGKRPLAGSVEQWAALVEARRPIYERLADIRIDTSSKTMDDVAEQILDWLHQSREFSE
ncbi:shikimate kinase [Gryllotalpicola sp.]|uniref:shikimate kinase n=1 Tax=Gryllotalpicola sp. TaxID=1932787 RepID=UPI0026181BD2|nr:shikimate kinase [Gryllotalpicola sp.]